MLPLEELYKIIDEAVEKTQWPAEPHYLYAPLKYMLDIGGKRIRPRFCLVTYNLFKDDIGPHIVNPAMAVELFHTFTLIHDDIMDNADLRRGKPTIFKKWNNNIAILSGDTMCISSYQMLSSTPKEHINEVVTLFSKTAIEICEGQQLDMDFEEMNNVSMDEYVNMITLKTAVLLACAAKMGAIIGGADKELCNQIYDFGLKLGLAFQIEDDYLDSFGDEKSFGKKIGGDILNNKKSWLLTRCREEALLKGKGTKLDALLETEPTDEKIAAFQEFYKELGINRLATEEIEKNYSEAIEILNGMSLNKEQKEQMRMFASSIVKRVK
ncbi:MAG: polyprenyl synthetase family protein [Bacteroidales bacterium]|nr:polyprenyl synthetase family protein [Bacteroidales bacterium]